MKKAKQCPRKFVNLTRFQMAANRVLKLNHRVKLQNYEWNKKKIACHAAVRDCNSSRSSKVAINET